MNKEIILLVGIPASGKSSFAKDQEGAIVISRDKIRESLLKESDSYFSREKEVFSTFVFEINKNITKGANRIIIDATHINFPSRDKLLMKLENYEDYSLVVKVFATSKQECLRRNNARSGFARVPDSAIESMYNNFSFPKYHEFTKYGFKDIIIEKEGE